MSRGHNAPKPKFVLLLGFRQRKDVLGPQGTNIEEGLTSDEIRVASLNRLLEGRARVITMNKKHDAGNKYHLDVNLQQSSWPRAFMVWLEKTHHGVITDIYLDYFFFLHTWYRLSYGTKWIEVLGQIEYTGTAYLPICRCPKGAAIDRDINQKLVDDVTRAGGKYIQNANAIDSIPLCMATIHVDEMLKNLSATRVHSWQIKLRIAGFVAITRQQIDASRSPPLPAASQLLLPASVSKHQDCALTLYNLAKTTNPPPTSVVPPSPPLPASTTPSIPLHHSVSASLSSPASMSVSPLPVSESPPVSPSPSLTKSVSQPVLPLQTCASPSIPMHNFVPGLLPLTSASLLPSILPHNFVSGLLPSASVSLLPSIPAHNFVSGLMPSASLSLLPFPVLDSSLTPSLSLPASESSLPTPAVAATPPLLRQLCVNAKFKDSGPRKIVIRQKAESFVIVLPAKLTGTSRRGYVAFSKASPFGVNPEFGNFVQRKLSNEVQRWNNLRDAHNWFQNQLVWKRRVSSSYRTRVTRLHGAVSRSPREASLISNANPADSVTIPVPDFPQLWTTHSRYGKVHAIRVRLSKHTKKDKAAAHLYFPRTFFGNQQSKRISLGTENGVNPDWVRFVVEYMSYCVNKWKTFDDAKTWIIQYKMMFVDFVQKLWRLGGGNVKPVNQCWSLRPSTLPVDQEYVDKGWFPVSARNDTGYGLWCTKPGTRLTIKFTVRGGITERTEGVMTAMQACYAMDIAETVQIVPHVDCFKCWVMHHGFLVGHRRLKDNPTHYAAVVDGVPCLLPRRPAQAEEICFDYGYHLSSAKNFTPIPDDQVVS